MIWCKTCLMTKSFLGLFFCFLKTPSIALLLFLNNAVLTTQWLILSAAKSCKWMASSFHMHDSIPSSLEKEHEFVQFIHPHSKNQIMMFCCCIANVLCQFHSLIQTMPPMIIWFSLSSLTLISTNLNSIKLQVAKWQWTTSPFHFMSDIVNSGPASRHLTHCSSVTRMNFQFDPQFHFNF